MKVRICPNCRKPNLENVWNCIACGETLSVGSLVDIENESTIKLLDDLRSEEASTRNDAIKKIITKKINDKQIVFALKDVIENDTSKSVRDYARTALDVFGVEHFAVGEINTPQGKEANSVPKRGGKPNPFKLINSCFVSVFISFGVTVLIALGFIRFIYLLDLDGDYGFFLVPLVPIIAIISLVVSFISLMSRD